MKTDLQLKAEIYTALTTDATLTGLISNRVYWFNPQGQDFPMIAYSLLDVTAEYVLGGCMILSHEYVDFQIDVYALFGQMTQLSQIVDRVKVLMMGKGYMMLPGNPELLESDRVQRIMRWRCINV